MQDDRTSFRVYTARELGSIPATSLRVSASAPSRGLGFSGVAFLLVVALAIGGTSWAAMRFVRADVVAAATAKADEPPAANANATATATGTANTNATANATVADEAPAPASTASKSKAKKARQAKPSSEPAAASGSVAPGEKPPPNPYDDLEGVDRGPTVP